MKGEVTRNCTSGKNPSWLEPVISCGIEIQNNNSTLHNELLKQNSSLLCE